MVTIQDLALQWNLKLHAARPSPFAKSHWIPVMMSIIRKLSEQLVNYPTSLGWGLSLAWIARVKAEVEMAGRLK